MDLSKLTADFRDHLAPLANAMDGDPVAMRQGLDFLAQRQLLALRRPTAYGGPEVDEATFRQFQIEVARASGALAFLQTQHQSAVGMLARSPNETLKQQWLPRMASGERMLGIGFSQLRRPGPPMMTATPDGDGYRLDGHVPWVTGHGFFSHFIIAAERPDGRAVFAVVPFTNAEGIIFSEPMRLAAMEAAQTVTAEVQGLVVSPDDIVFLQPKGWIQRSDLINVTLQGFFALGCARAGLDILALNAERKQTDFMFEALAQLQEEWEALSHAMAARPDEQEYEARLQLRASAIDLMTRCAHAGVVSSSGAANSLDHPAQRVWRESIVFTVSAQTTDIMAASLARLASGRRLSLGPSV